MAAKDGGKCHPLPEPSATLYKVRILVVRKKGIGDIR